MSEPTRILVVDDDAKIRTVVRRGLAYEGYRVVEAASGEEGLEKAREHLPDLVILDDVRSRRVTSSPSIPGIMTGDELAILMLTARDVAPVWRIVRGPGKRTVAEDAIAIVRARFARGEISVEEFERAQALALRDDVESSR